MELTTEQIQEVQNALVATRVVHYDILIEITDHVASVLEKQEGDFKENLTRYIQDNKAELQTLNRKFKRIGAAKGMRLLFTNLFSWKILLIFIGIISLGKVIKQFAAPNDMGIFMFLIFTVCSCIGCYPGIKSIVLKKEIFSFSLGIGILPALLFYPSIPMLSRIPNPDFLIVYYAAVAAFMININFTTRALYHKYTRIYYA